MPRLAAAGAVNVAARALLVEWQPLRAAIGLPACEPRLAASGAVASTATALARRWDPQGPRVRLNAGRVAWLEGHCAAAREHWAQALAAAPGDRIAAFWLFWASAGTAGVPPAGLPPAELSRYAYAAGTRARAAASTAPDAASIEAASTDAASIEAASTDAASAWYELSLRLSPGRDAVAALAGLYRARGQGERAIALWRWLADALPPEDSEHWWALGQEAEQRAASDPAASDPAASDPAASDAAAWEQAARAYARGAATADRPYEFWMRQAAALGRLDRPRDQEGAYHRAIAACPDCPAPYLELGHLWRRQGQLRGALSWYEEAARVAPRDANPPYYQAQVLHEAGDGARAVELLQRALALHRGRPWRWALQLGDWRRDLGDHAGAGAAYRRALEWAPGETTIQERILDLRQMAGKE